MSFKSNYYHNTAYRPDNIPALPNQKEDYNRYYIDRQISVKLPWGNAPLVAPRRMIIEKTPKSIREIEKLGEEFEGAGEFDKEVHIRLRFRNYTKLSRFIVFIYAASRFFTLAGFPIMLSIYIWRTKKESSFDWFYQKIIDSPDFFIAWTLVPLSIWMLTSLTFKFFPTWMIRSGRGPEWEFNRKTGMVTVWKYPSRILFKQRGAPTVEIYHFCEFDAYDMVTPCPQGTRNDFYFFHRYKKLEVPLGRHLLKGQFSPYPSYALWDFLQNYMDVSKPLLDIPMFEKYRHLDPTTAEHDQKVGRTKHYWRNMDMKTFRKKVNEMELKVKSECNVDRPCVMEQKIQYANP